ncbi:hypothetical protein M407DRAFT_231788 [Tulasnella calospora MUT 4182]|uniref:SGNH domain-containing protein n=1 Tax=Tulasnella calospora MUT 4182 TaxID=1051891 RepID=A0A0C3QX83_9AGAM|nr:hypothetical protein M407DRAFT_231788 [Tulasnella calospora MUT 4182]
MPASNASPKSQRGLTGITISLLIVIIALFLLYSNTKLPAHFHLHDAVLGALPPTLHSCPSPYDVGRPPVTHDGQSCEHIPSNNDAFDMELCHQTYTCNEFTFRIRRTNLTACMASEGGPNPSLDPELSKWIRDTRGPDAFLVRTDGAERYATISDTYEGNCSYAFDIRLKNPGTVYLQVWWTFSNYQAYSETDERWPEQHLSLVDSPIALSICPSNCVPTPPTRLLPNATVMTIPSSSPGDRSPPACSGSAPIRGSYLPAHPLDILYPPVTLPQGHNYPIIGRYNLIPESCRWKHAGVRFSDRIEQCTDKKRKVLFFGDSHGRVAWDAMVYRLSGHQDILTVSSKAGSKNTTVGNTDFKFLWDPRGVTLAKPAACEEMIDADVVVVSVAAHLAASHQFSTTQYTQTLQSIFSTTSGCPLPPGSSNRTLVYMTAPAAPPRTDEYVRKFADRRTNVRLQHWADLGTKVALNAGWSVVDQFNLTLPQNLEPLHTDMAHYLATDAMDPIVDEVIGKIGICSEEGD